MKRRTLVRLCLGPLLVLSWPLSPFSQDIRATLSGQVTDASGSAVPNATVAVINTETHVVSPATTNNAGRFVVNFLIPGRYKLEVEANGFKKFVRENIQLEVGDKAGIDASLQMGEISDNVTVTDEMPLIETETGSRGQVITGRQLADLPNNGRNAYQLVWAVPGVIKTGGYWGSMENYALGNATGASINGGKRRENETLLDGAKNGYNQWMTRVDYAINSGNTVYIRYGRLPFTEFDGILFGGDSPAEPSRENPLLRNFYNWNADWASTLSSTTVLNLRFGLARYINIAGSPPAAGFDPQQLGFEESLVSQFRFLNFPRFNLGQYTAIGT